MFSIRWQCIHKILSHAVKEIDSSLSDSPPVAGIQLLSWLPKRRSDYSEMLFFFNAQWGESDREIRRDISFVHSPLSADSPPRCSSLHACQTRQSDSKNGEQSSNYFTMLSQWEYRMLKRSASHSRFWWVMSARIISMPRGNHKMRHEFPSEIPVNYSDYFVSWNICMYMHVTFTARERLQARILWRKEWKSMTDCHRGGEIAIFWRTEKVHGKDVDHLLPRFWSSRLTQSKRRATPD